MRTFYKLLGVALIVGTTNNFVWFALTFWAYLTTLSVISTSIVGGVFIGALALSGIWFGSIVDHNRKKIVMLGSSVVTLILFSLGLLLFRSTPIESFSTVSSPMFWVLVLVLLSGTIAGAIYNIAIPTLVGLTVPEELRDKANGMFGTVAGISFALTSVASGFALAFGGMAVVLMLAIGFTALAILILAFITIPEDKPLTSTEPNAEKIDVKGTIRIVRAVPGLFPLIFFSTFNNFLGGIFMALMDAYGLSLVSVQVWGLLWGFLSLGFIIGGLYISTKGLGSDPLRTLFRIYIVMWIVCIFFTIQASIVLLAVGVFIWLCLAPFAEATEATIFQKVVPPERLGRVFGFAHSVEQAASPLTAFMIGPVAQFVFIPFMTTGGGVDLIGSWFGTGIGRGIALVFILAGIIGLIVTLIAMRSRPYHLLREQFLKPSDAVSEEATEATA